MNVSDIYFIVNVGWTEYLVGGQWDMKRELQNLAEQYPDATVNVYSKESHNLFFENLTIQAVV